MQSLIQPKKQDNIKNNGGWGLEEPGKGGGWTIFLKRMVGGLHKIGGRTPLPTILIAFRNKFYCMGLIMNCFITHFLIVVAVRNRL